MKGPAPLWHHAADSHNPIARSLQLRAACAWMRCCIVHMYVHAGIGKALPSPLVCLPVQGSLGDDEKKRRDGLGSLSAQGPEVG